MKYTEKDITKRSRTEREIQGWIERERDTGMDRERERYREGYRERYRERYTE